ncbi:MAG TPA: phenylalanine--tRNA ligase beta subunit-related protein [Thermoleophilaceae bacterium]|nr:phenylalanine--tRNA ligase beta subunit-related protein [Thermoleophilaceae bacterium]
MELDLREGWVATELAEEFPELGLTYAPLEAKPRSSPRPVKQRLRALADRYTGSKVVHMRQDPVPWAYRVFSRQVGIDPDTDRTPAEKVALDRLKWGGFRSQNVVDDALTIAVAETGVPVIAFDGDLCGASLGLRLAGAGEKLGGGRPLASGQLIVADEEKPLAVVLGEIGQDAGVTPQTQRMVLAALAVKGVPRISVEEALWTAAETLVEG